MQKRNAMGALALCMLLAVTLTACGKKGEEPLTTPEAYVLGENSAPPFDQQLTEGGSLVSLSRQYPVQPEETAPPTEAPLSQESPAPEGSPAPEKKDDKKDGEPQGDPDSLIYTYAELPVAGALVESYAKVLADLEDPFQPVDKEGQPTEASDYTGETGTVRLARNAVEPELLYRIRLDWTPTSCAVTVDRVEGHLEKPKPPVQVEPMTLTQAVQYLEGISPQRLGLEGDSMDVYDVYPIEGIVMVNGQACIQFRVYRQTDQGTNDVKGMYLMTADRSHLYRLDPQTGEVMDKLAQ